MVLTKLTRKVYGMVLMRLFANLHSTYKLATSASAKSSHLNERDPREEPFLEFEITLRNRVLHFKSPSDYTAKHIYIVQKYNCASFYCISQLP